MVDEFCNRLDLRFNGKLNSKISIIFNEISFNYRSKFNDLVSTLSEPNKHDLDWWVEGPASRNTLSSPFFHYYCSLYLIQYLLDSKKFTFKEVILDSLELRTIVKKMLAESGISYCRVCVNHRKLIKLCVKRYLNFPVLFFRKFVQQIIARFTLLDGVQGSPHGPLVLIDTFMIKGYIENDRWYGDLWENLDSKRRAETFFVPTIVNTSITDMMSLYRGLRCSYKNYIIKEDYLKLTDILYAFGHLFRIKNSTIRPVRVLDYDVSPLVKKELLHNEDMLTIIESLLIYRFVKRLSENDLKVRLAIDWFEGQAIDKAWNIAFKNFYPSVKRVGYRATESFPFYLCSYPIAIERDSGAIPDVIAIQGKATALTVTEFLPDLRVVVVPALRSQHVWSSDMGKKIKSNFTILVSLPISKYTSVRIMMRLVEVSNNIDFGFKKIKFIVKVHPVNSIMELKKQLPIKLPNVFLMSEEKSFPVLLKKIDLLITEASSTCLEALACGIPVIMMENEEGLTFDPIPERIPEGIVFKTRTVGQLVNAIQYNITATKDELKEQKEMGKRIREDYFEPLSEEGINRFFDIATKEKVQYA